MTKKELWGLLLAIIVVMVLGLLLTPANAQQQLGPDYDAYAFEQVTVSTTAIGLTAATVSPTTAAGARQAFCHVESQPLRYRWDGTNPSSTVGHPAAAGTTITLTGINNILRFRAIRSGGTDATLTCTLSR